MGVAVYVLLISAVVEVAKGVMCHDCSSWNPYCRDEVDEPFESAVAAVECEKTNTCFLKKDEKGVINRGCADWWMESQVNIHYVGCQTQHVPWLGEMTWCFCKTDYCNGGSVEKMSQGVFPVVEQSSKKEWGDYDENWDDETWTEDHAEKQEGSEMEQTEWNQPEAEGHGNTFDDVRPSWVGGSNDARKNSDPKYQLWFWHADSDRPQWQGRDNGWHAPEWVERDDGLGWDFPVAGGVHSHGSSEEHADLTAPNNVAADVNDYDYDYDGDDTTRHSTTTWNWGNGWAHIKPWWLKESAEEVTTDKPKRWTHPPTPGPKFQDDGWARLPKKWGRDHRDRVEMWGQNIVDEILQNDSKDQDIHVDLHEEDLNEINHEISHQEFFCWDCYSDSPLCGETVDIVKAAYLGKSACGATNKCFVRNDNGVIYRGCADGWTSSVIDTGYVGCRVQQMWERKVEWCFCTASLCNGDSMQSIKDKYMEAPAFEPFKDTLETTQVTTPVVTTTAPPPANHPPFHYILTPFRRLRKRSTVTNSKGENSTVPVNFHVETDTELPSFLNAPSAEGAFIKDGKSVSVPQNVEEDNTSMSAKDWMTTSDTTTEEFTRNGNEDTATGSGVVADDAVDKFLAGADLEGLFR